MRILSELGEAGCKTSVCLLLQGSKEEVLLAHCVLENLVLECSPVTETLEVPQTALGRIIGTCDNMVLWISKQSYGIRFLDPSVPCESLHCTYNNSNNNSLDSPFAINISQHAVHLLWMFQQDGKVNVECKSPRTTRIYFLLLHSRIILDQPPPTPVCPPPTKYE